MNFGRAQWLWLLALIPVLVVVLVWAYRARRRALEQFAAQPLADRLARTVRRVARVWKAVLLVTGITLVLFALAQPRWGFEWRQVKRKGVDVLVLLDVSKSMLAEDLKPNRLAQAKFAVEDLLAKLAGDRVGLIAFAGTAFVQCPLTVDYDAFRLALREAGPRFIPRGGTAIGPAIKTAVKAFEAGEGRDRAIVLITDGESTEGEVATAAEMAAQAGVRIYAIGVGTADGELIPVREGGGSVDFLKDREGKVVKSRLDEETLKQLALQTQGIYVRSAPGDFGMETVYERGISQLQRKEYEERLQKTYFERFQWPLAIGLVLLAVEMFLSDRRRLVVLAFLLLGPGWAVAKEPNWPRTYNSGVTAYRSNDFSAAASAFEQAAAAQDRQLQTRALYNLGNTRYRLGQAAEEQGIEQALPVYKQSLKAYENVLALAPQDEDAKFNLDLVKKKIEELETQQQQQQNQDKQDQKDQQKQDQQQRDKADQDKQNQAQDQQQDQPPEQKPDEAKPDTQPQPADQKPEQQPAEAQPSPGDNFDKQRAAALLDNLREEERNWNFFPEAQMKDLKEAGEPAKDW